MFKKRYIIIVLGLVSVLLGSLLYTNLASAGDITPSGKPQPPVIHKESVKVSLVRPDHIVEYQGVVIYRGSEFPFLFSPKEAFIDVTDMSIFMIHCGRTTTFSMNLSLNGVQVMTLDIPKMDSPVTYHIHVEDVNVYSAVHSGINVLTFEGGEGAGSIRIQELSIFIEYEYQA